MERVTITLDEELMEELDRLIARRGYQNRSEAIRDLARSGIRQANEKATPTRDCVAALVYVFDHRARELSKRLARLFHERHDLSLSAMRVHLDHDSCMEVSVLRGKTDEVARFADHLMAERGVRHGRLVTVPVDAAEEKHAHGAAPGHRHLHLHVRDAG
ncbi:MAG TPA: nickel-responsive transcriptional regulator NikR [Stellaceae bacterium]|nr:nickel-responsive transcriptional regulator NikR [Stellaceae bacterium]